MHPIRVFHIPYQIPYTRKIASSFLRPVIMHTGWGSRSLYLQRPFLSTELDTFDVLHIHSLRYGTVQGLKDLLEQCKNNNKRVIYTAHDLRSLRNDDATHYEKLHQVCAIADAVITLTYGCAEKLLQIAGNLELSKKLSIIPHGFAVHPHHSSWGISGSSKKTVQYALYGSFRHNRDILGFAQAWFSALKETDAQLNVLLRTSDEVLVTDPQLRVEETLTFLRSNPQRMRVLLAPSFTNEYIIRFLSLNDILAMPYLWGTHSGQLEMAFDLQLLPLITQVGFFSEQWQWIQSYVPEPNWFHCSDFSSGNIQMQETIKEVQMRARERFSYKSSSEWKSYRLWEHQQLIQAHYQLYSGARSVGMSFLSQESSNGLSVCNSSESGGSSLQKKCSHTGDTEPV